MSWRDSRVTGQIQATYDQLKAGNYTCQLPCQSNNKAISGGCCDDVWMPYIAMPNIKYLPQDRVVRYGFGWDPKGVDDGVFYWRSIHGIWYTPMDLRAFPFDRQNLMIQMEVPQTRTGWSGGLVNLIPSVTGTEMFSAKASGDDVSGWVIDTVHLIPFSYVMCRSVVSNALTVSPPDEPAPLIPANLEHLRGKDSAADCVSAISSQPRPYDSVYWWRPLTGNGTNVVKVTGLNAIIVVTRFRTRWIMSAVFPICATTWLGFFVFLLPRKDMDARLGAIVALFLALAAIQYVIDADVPSSSYVTALQQLTLTSYVALIIIGIENVGIWYLTLFHKEAKRKQRHEEANKKFRAKMDSVSAVVDAWIKQATQSANKHKAGRGRGRVSWLMRKASQTPGVQRRASFLNKDVAAMPSAAAGMVAAPAAAEAAPRAAASRGEVRLYMGGATAASQPPSGAPGLDTAAAAAHGVNEALTLRDAAAGATEAAARNGDDLLEPSLVATASYRLSDAAGEGRHAASAARDDAGGAKGGAGFDQFDQRQAGAQCKRRSSESGSEGSTICTVDHDDLADWIEEAMARKAAGTRRWYQTERLDYITTSLHLRWAMVRQSAGYADRLAHKFNKWAGVTQWLLYNVCVVLIFTINTKLYAERMLPTNIRTGGSQ